MDHQKCGRAFIGAHLAFAKTPSARLYKTATDTKKSNPGIDWREAVLETFGLDEDEIEVALLFSDPAFPSNAQRWKEFERWGFGSRAKFYRLARAMSLIGTEPKGDDADSSASPVPSTSFSIHPSQIMETLGFGAIAPARASINDIRKVRREREAG